MSEPLVLTDADAAADLAGTPRPDNPTAEGAEQHAPAPTENVFAEVEAVLEQLAPATLSEAEPAPVATLVPEDIPANHVKIELGRDISLWINGVEKSFVAGWHVVHEDLFASISQTHLLDAVK